ncbi:threonylcarbamoyl-AMP synthase [Tamlana fucoidanivorans]|uniref:Threonylcarbamoyl-AMP synthase n=1 Tax=Allotamlana fucoidanivorans TaxID=2583814 RepID=A0A5C4SKD7_9FLAO|nr:L-threonylcarbamoyladenylate synthase [Tamlana fucoidanivorans]TNJ44313.1 threonylcarbamoyl-AMP synthase [Tamlana fucoidanivorans]
MSIISKDIQQAASILRTDDIVAIPTETVYGLAGNIYSETAIKKIFSTKLRPFFNPLIVHIPSVDDLPEIVSYIPDKAKLLAEAFWPGSMTLVLKKQAKIPDLITAKKDTVAVRVPNHPVTLALLEEIEFPLAAPSANPFGSISPTKPEHVEHYFKNDIKQVLDGGACMNGIESTIIGFEGDEPIVYRFGALALEVIEAVVGPVKVKTKDEISPEAPGMLERHYAPSTKTILTDDLEDVVENYSNKRIGILAFRNKLNREVSSQIILSETGNLEEAASRLYDALHQLDHENIDIIIAERLPNHGLGKSINDRLERATK